MHKSCPVVVLRKREDRCKHRAVSMDKSCSVVVLENSKKVRRVLCVCVYVKIKREFDTTVVVLIKSKEKKPAGKQERQCLWISLTLRLPEGSAKR